jgi:hypothetical protein
MVSRRSRFKRLGHSALVGLLVAVMAVPAVPVLAASNRPIQNFRSNSGSDRQPFNMDQNPCPGNPGGRGYGQGSSGNCYYRPDQQQQRGNGPRHPGSNAFGLQFNSGDF